MKTKTLLLFVVMAIQSPNLYAETKVNAYFAPGQEIKNITGVRYKCSVLENKSPHIMIIFGFHRTYGSSKAGPSNGTYMLESNVYANGLKYSDGVITTDASIQGAFVPTQASLRAAVAEYHQPIHCWTQTSSPDIFPRQTYLIDAITNLWKTDMVSQTNLNDVEFSVEVSRAGILNNFSSWQSAEPSDKKTVFRVWRIIVKFGGKTYTNQYAIPDMNARYLKWDEFLEFESEFLWRTDHFRVQMWDFQMQREQEKSWRPVNNWQVTRQDDAPTKYGARVAQNGNRRVIEISNIGQPDYMPLNTRFDLSLPPRQTRRPSSQ
jgi:hypothetical protein